MSEEPFDNTNRGAGWPVDQDVASKTLRIKADIDGVEHYGILIRTGAESPKAPCHNLFLYPGKSKTAHLVAIFRNDKGGHKIAGGELLMPNGIGYWVSLFKNKSEHPQSPVLDISFQPKEVQPPPEPENMQRYSEPADPTAAEADVSIGDNNIPF